MNRETVEAYGLGAAGALVGVFNYYVRPEITAKRGWLVIGAGVLAYELACPNGELLSQGVDRALETHPTATRAAIGYTALHLMNLIPKPEIFDPLTVITQHLKDL